MWHPRCKRFCHYVVCCMCPFSVLLNSFWHPLLTPQTFSKVHIVSSTIRLLTIITHPLPAVEPSLARHDSENELCLLTFFLWKFIHVISNCRPGLDPASRTPAYIFKKL